MATPVLIVAAVMFGNVAPAVYAWSRAVRRPLADFAAIGPERIDVLLALLLSCCFGLGSVALVWYRLAMPKQSPRSLSDRLVVHGALRLVRALRAWPNDAREAVAILRATHPVDL